MTQTLTSRVKAIKNDDAETVLISELNSGFDKFDNHFIPACMIENNAVQSVPSGGLQLMTYNATIYDSFAARSEGAMADLSNDRIICRKAGVYDVEATIWTTTLSATGVMSLGLYVNGNGIKMEQVVPGNNQVTQSVHDSIVLAVNDVITVNAIQTSGAARNYTRNTWPHGFSLSAMWKGSVVEV